MKNFCWVLVIFLTLKLSVMAKTDNALYKIELTKKDPKTVSVVIYTAKKYSFLPDPIKTTGTNYVLFLSNTENLLKTQPSVNHIKDMIDSVEVDFFPLLSSKDRGYTKISIETNPNEDVDLSIENYLYELPKKAAPVVIKKIDPQVNVKPEKIQEKLEPQPEKVKVITEVKEVIKEVKVRDYSIGILIAIGLVFFNILVLITRSFKKKPKDVPVYDGSLSSGLLKKIEKFNEDDSLLLFTENKELIDVISANCSQRNVRLQVATSPDFNFNDFYKHNDFYKNLSPKPTGVIFDINLKIDDKKLEKDFDFIDLKKYVDCNYTNLFLILNLFLKDFCSNNGFIIFTDSDVKILNNRLSGKICYATTNALIGLIVNLKKDNKVFYYKNDLL